MILSVRPRFAVCTVCAFFAIVTYIIWSSGTPYLGHPRNVDLYPSSTTFSSSSCLLSRSSTSASLEIASDESQDAATAARSSKPCPAPTPGVYYKNSIPAFEYEANHILEHFPQAACAKSPKELPAVASWNNPPSVHVAEVTPLFIGFTRNWPLLQQAVVGYITAGWPPEDIFVIENTGTMLSNAKGLLNESNPFYLDHNRLTSVFGVNVMVTPALLSFAQLQNLCLYEAIKNNWTHYFWSHMDVLPQSWEDRDPYKSLYMRAVEIMRESFDQVYGKDNEGHVQQWALRYLSYDWLTLINTAAMVELGGWDSMISYYSTDCDMYERMRMLGLKTDTADAGKIWDIGESLSDLEVLYRINDVRNGSGWHELQTKLQGMEHAKVHGQLPRNSWQMQQRGGRGQPFYRDLAGFEEALEITIKAGQAVYAKKWGTGRCDLRGVGLKLEDEWRVEKVVV